MSWVLDGAHQFGEGAMEFFSRVVGVLGDIGDRCIILTSVRWDG